MPWRIEWHPELGSTMDRIAELASAGAPAGTVVVADFQSSGRGTHGRRWDAPPGTCLMFSVLARPDIPADALQSLPARIARSVCDVLATRHGVPATVKPPNDIVVQGRKICGVLVTSRITGERLEWITVGIGLNTRMTADELPVEGSTSMLVEGVRPVPAHEELLSAILSGLEWLLVQEPSCAGYGDKPILSSNAE